MPWLQSYEEGVRANLEYSDLTLHGFLWQTAAKYPGLRATVFLGEEMTYLELEEKVKRCASALKVLGVKKGDRVAVMLPNCPQFVIAY